MSDTTQRFNEWIKTQTIVLHDVSMDGGHTWSQETVEPTDLARAAWMESARQADAVWVYVTDPAHVLRRGVDMIRGYDGWEVVDGLDGETLLKSGCELCRYRVPK